MKSLSLRITVLVSIFLFVFSVQASAADQKLPSASALVEAHIDALGGEKALKKLEYKNIKGSLNIAAMGLNGNLHVLAKVPNILVAKTEFPQFGAKGGEGYNGEIAWRVDPMMGNKILDGEALAAMRAKADFFADSLSLTADATKLETLEVVEFDGNQHYKVLKVAPSGESFLYFSKDTGLLAGIDSMQLTPQGKMPTETRITQYQQYGDVLFATKMVSTQGGMAAVIEFSSVSFEAIPEAEFKLPAEIVALQK